MNFTGVYDYEAFARNNKFIWLDCRHLYGTDGYCDREGAVSYTHLDVYKRQFPVEGGSPLIGKTIREADILDSIIIGIERSTVNIMNPDPDTIFKENDTVWIVGKQLWLSIPRQ